MDCPQLLPGRTWCGPRAPRAIVQRRRVDTLEQHVPAVLAAQLRERLRRGTEHLDAVLRRGPRRIGGMGGGALDVGHIGRGET